jgi:hypothetical protein
MRLNEHMGARGIMSPGRIQDPEGARIIESSFEKATRAFAAIHTTTPIQNDVLRGSYASGRLRVDSNI